MTSQSPLRLGLAGLGTVGGGVVKMVQQQADLLTARAGRPIVITAVSARNRAKDRGVDLSAYAWEDDPVALARRDDIDVLVEVMGGSDGPAKAASEAALSAGKALVTANKALLAMHGAAMAPLADARGTQIRYEAAIAGGIPIVKALREGLAGNRISRVFGVLNGTCNYILTEMERTGRDFADILVDAQKLGYAEADPTADVGGFDAAHKLALLSAIAFGVAPDMNAIEIEGIENVAIADIEVAGDLGYRVRLMAVSALIDGELEQRVAPCLAPADSDIGRLTGVTNAVVCEGDFIGRIACVGPGAGEGATASAILGDLVDLARGDARPVFGAPVGTFTAPAPRPTAAHRGRYYLRFVLDDRPGTLATVAAALGDAGVSIESMRQYGRNADATVAIVTHETTESAVQTALSRIGETAICRAAPAALRIEDI